MKNINIPEINWTKIFFFPQKTCLTCYIQKKKKCNTQIRNIKYSNGRIKIVYHLFLPVSDSFLNIWMKKNMSVTGEGGGVVYVSLNV